MPYLKWIRYWQCVYCAQKHRKSQITRNPAAHLVRILLIHGDNPTKTKRLKQAQLAIQKSMQVATAAEVRRIKEQEREIQWIDVTNSD